MFANILWDLILVSVLLAGIILGIKKGFISTVAKPVKFIAAIVIALSLASAIGGAIFEPIIGPAISNKLSDILIEKYSHITAETANQELPTVIKFAASLCGIDVSNITSTAEGGEIITQLVDSVTDPVVQIITSIIGFIVVYFIAKILLSLLVSFINSLVNNGVAGAVNKSLGAVFSLLLAVCIAWVFTIFTEFIFNIPLISDIGWIDAFTGGPVYRFFKSFSPLDILLSF